MVKPQAPLRRTARSSALHILSVTWIAVLVLAVTSRPIFAAFVALALVGLVVAISNAKYESLREPFVFTDLSLFSQLFSHPRLYLPFLSIGKVVAIVVGVMLVIGGFAAEPAVARSSTWLLLLLLVVLFLAVRMLAAGLPLSLDPCVDQARHGFFAVFVAYLMNGLRSATFAILQRAMVASPFGAGRPQRRTDVIVIQSESFFDIRRVCDAVDSSGFVQLDRARREAVHYGELTVPAWGANTMRTEFAVLAGIPSAALGYAQFYPYAFVRRACISLARWFARAGYATLAIHPYYADFFGRNRVFPLLGFEQFLDIGHFKDAARAGPYVADAAVAEAVISTLNAQGDRPRFVFAMTMENHGPLHLEQVLPGESSSRHTLGEDASWRDLTAYLRHIENADAMIGRLLDHLRASDRETVVCFYGDHVPALPHVFQKLGVTPQRSDYFIWRNYGTDTPERRNLAAEELGSVLLDVVKDDGNRAEEPHASEKAT
ncbi:putative capsular polysaccharide biosynthesis sulfatase membrane protein [Burkholderia contaminans]|uniref:Putative capsular polysaccharide biosynthesis sulfatase membrane protein n=2 Tax=Burkholderia contaminans TaxID=488447 RepID=A0A6P2ZMI8_9BURK|nr:LTA synthase family protein [Burkholderia contaminans]VWD36237.1 putative capsular polysaccharide biosynthesis sulfatase membrane protein [Burkholderia contaminans]